MATADSGAGGVDGSSGEGGSLGMVSLADARQQVADTTRTVQQSMQQMAERDNQLRGIDTKSATLNTTAGQFSQSSRKLRLQMQAKQYLMYLVMGLLIVDAFAYLAMPDRYWSTTFCLLVIGGAGYGLMRMYLRYLDDSVRQGSNYVEFGGEAGETPMGNTV